MKFLSKFILMISFLMVGLGQVIAMERPKSSSTAYRTIFYDRARGGMGARGMFETAYQFREGQVFKDKQPISLIEWFRVGNVQPEQIKYFYVEEPSGDFTPLQRLIEGPQLKALLEQPITASQTQLQVSNQTNQNAKVWVTIGEEQSHPESIAPGQDSSSITPPLNSSVSIESMAGIYTLKISPNNSLSLYTPLSREKQAMRAEDARDVLVVISPDGSVDIAKRNRQ